MFTRQVSQLVHIFFCFACWWTPENSACLTEVTTLLNLENYSKSVLFMYSPFRCYFKHFDKLCGIFNQFPATLDAACCYLKSAILLVHQNYKWNSVFLHLTWHFASWKWPCKFHSISSERSLCYQQWCCLVVSPETDHTTFLESIRCCEITL
jgi:hypothetical protein